MPKIAAATVAEHHDRRRGALLDAARELLLSGGYAALSFAELAQRTGMARPTVYSYFRSKDDVVVALCEVELPLAGADTDAAVARAGTPRDRLAAFVRAQLRAARDGRYRLAHTLVDASLSARARRQIMDLHRELMPSAVPLLTQLGHPHPVLAAALVQSMVNAAVLATDAGEPPARVQRVTLAAVLDGVGGHGRGEHDRRGRAAARTRESL
jgi:AcrR family transcriptional regulator